MSGELPQVNPGNAMSVVTLRTARLVLSPLSEHHSAGMFALWSSPEVCEYSGSAQDVDGNPIALPARTPTDSDKILRFFVERQKQNIGIRWAMTLIHGGEFVGALGFNSLGPMCELAYHLNPVYWGRGLMTEACQAILEWAVSHVGARRFEAFIEDANLASAKLVRALGFADTGEIKHGARRYLVNVAL